MISLILIAIFISLYVLYKATLEEQIPKKWLRVLIDTILVVIIIPICVNLLMPLFQREERLKEETFREEIRNGIYSKKMNKKELEQYVQFKYRETFDSSAESAAKWVDDLVKSEKYATNKEILADKSTELAEAYRLRWYPVYKYSLELIDARIQELQRTESIKIEENDTDVVLVNNFKGTNEQVRRFIFPNGHAVIIKIAPARIQAGTLETVPHIDFFENVSGQYFDSVFTISLNERITQISASNRRYDGADGINYSTENDPLQDDKFKKNLERAISQIISFIYLHE